MPVTVTGYITRSNLPSPLGNLSIAVDPLWMLPGDSSEDASITRGAGVEPAMSSTKRVWADSPFVAGQQLVLGVPDNSTLDLRIQCDGAGSIANATTYAGEVITAIRNQMTFQVSLTFDTQTFTWNCYMGDYVVAMNQLFVFGYTLPLYVSLPRDPTPASGPV